MVDGGWCGMEEVIIRGVPASEDKSEDREYEEDIANK